MGQGYLLLITSAPITPGTQPQQVSRVTMTIEPQPIFYPQSPLLSQSSSLENRPSFLSQGLVR